MTEWREPGSGSIAMGGGEPLEAAKPLPDAEQIRDDTATLNVAAAKARIATLDAPPQLDLRAHARAAEAAGRRTLGLLWELGQAMLGPGRLTVHEHFYYRLDDPGLARDAVWRFVGKRRQRVFHTRCNDAG